MSLRGESALKEKLHKLSHSYLRRDLERIELDSLGLQIPAASTNRKEKKFGHWDVQISYERNYSDFAGHYTNQITENSSIEFKFYGHSGSYVPSINNKVEF